MSAKLGPSLVAACRALFPRKDVEAEDILQVVRVMYQRAAQIIKHLALGAEAGALQLGALELALLEQQKKELEGRMAQLRDSQQRLVRFLEQIS